MGKRTLVVIFVLIGCILYSGAFAQSTERDALKKKIEMAMKRLELRIDKVDKDIAKIADGKSKDQSNEYKAKLEAAKNELAGDLKRLATVKDDEWKDFKEDVDEHLEEAKTDIKPTML